MYVAHFNTVLEYNDKICVHMAVRCLIVVLLSVLTLPLDSSFNLFFLNIRFEWYHN